MGLMEDGQLFRPRSGVDRAAAVLQGTTRTPLLSERRTDGSTRVTPEVESSPWSPRESQGRG